MEKMPKRFLVGGLVAIGCLILALNLLTLGSQEPLEMTTATPPAETIPEQARETMFYEKLANQAVRCRICFRNCLIEEGQWGFCRNRVNQEGVLYNIVYGKPSALMVDPVEKEPQFHFLPGSRILCLGTAGCNFRCRFCHNWHLSQRSLDQIGYIRDLSPKELVQQAIQYQVPTLSFTYNEPTTFYEYIFDAAQYAQQQGIRVIFHTNGAINPEPLRALLPYIDGVTVDLKGFTEEFYHNLSDASLAPVLETLQIIREAEVWLEIVNLVIPTHNDDPETIEAMCQWIAETLGPDTPLHFTRFFPSYRLTDLPPTPVETLETAYDIARRAGLEYVYVGNVPGHRFNSTHCPSCDERVIDRYHFSVHRNTLVNGHCPTCGHRIPGVWERTAD